MHAASVHFLTSATDSDVLASDIACPSDTNGRDTDLKSLPTDTVIDRVGVTCLVCSHWHHNTRNVDTVSNDGRNLIGRSSPAVDNIITHLGDFQ